MPTVTHLAGPPVIVLGRMIQRCLICGEKLIDSKGVMVPVGQGPVSPWPEQVYIRTEGNATWRLIEDIATHLPDDLCISLVEA